MDVDLDHYVVLGLPSGEEGAKLSEKEISKAYRLKALELHPDKRPDDPNANDNFQKLKTSFEVLKDEKARRLFDDLLRVRKEKIQRQSFQDSKRRKMMSDLEERERSAYVVDPHRKPQGEEEQIARKLKDEIARIRAMFGRQTSSPSPMPKEETGRSSKVNVDKENGLDKEKMLKVTWEIGEDYTAQRLREIFSEFGVVEDVVKRTKKRSALVVMASKDAAVAATKNALGSLSNPLFVMPLQPVQATKFFSFSASRGAVDDDKPRVSEFVGVGYQAFEESVLDKMMKKESVEWEHKIKAPGKMHACGYDARVVMLLGAAKILQERRDDLQDLEHR